MLLSQGPLRGKPAKYSLLWEPRGWQKLWTGTVRTLSCMVTLTMEGATDRLAEAFPSTTSQSHSCNPRALPPFTGSSISRCDCKAGQVCNFPISIWSDHDNVILSRPVENSSKRTVFTVAELHSSTHCLGGELCVPYKHGSGRQEQSVFSGSEDLVAPCFQANRARDKPVKYSRHANLVMD